MIFLFVLLLGLLSLISSSTICQAGAVMQMGEGSNWWALSPHINPADND